MDPVEVRPCMCTGSLASHKYFDAEVRHFHINGGFPEMGRRLVYVGMDPSLTNYGLVALDDTGVGEAWSYASRNKGVERLNGIYEWISAVLFSYILHEPGIGGICLEGYSFGNHSTRSHALGEAGAATKLAILNRLKIGNPLAYPTIVPPTVLKKFVTGSGAAPKDVMRLGTFKRWGVEFPSTDMTDAYGLARAALVLYAGAPDAQVRVLETIRGQTEWSPLREAPKSLIVPLAPSTDSPALLPRKVKRHPQLKRPMTRTF